MVGVASVKPMKDYTLFLTFTNGRKGVLDVKPYLNRGPVFRQIANPVTFSSVRVSDGETVEWVNGADICPDTVYAKTVFVD